MKTNFIYSFKWYQRHKFSWINKSFIIIIQLHKLQDTSAGQSYDISMGKI